MIRNLMELGRELLNAAVIALDPGELHDTARRQPAPDPCTEDAPMCSGASCAGCVL